MDRKIIFFQKLDELLNNCLRGLLHYRMWENMADFLSDKEKLLDKYLFFWEQNLLSNISMSKLYLIKLYDKQSKSIDIISLVRDLNKNPSLLINPEKDRTKAKELEKKIIEIKTITENLREIRRKHFIHLSKEYLGDYPSLYKANPVNKMQIKQALDASADILNTINNLTRDTQLFMRFPDEHQTTFLLTDLHRYINEV